MGIFYKTFENKVRKVWKIAHSLNKPVDESLPWTMGLIKGRSDFSDLQVHTAALISSIIINEPVVPKIICAWDLPIDPNTTKWDYKKRCDIYPVYLLSLFDKFSMDFLLKKNIFSCYEMNTKYVDMYRSGFSVNSIPIGLALGYRSKYLGLNYVIHQSHAIMSDVDTICTRPCVGYLKEQIAKNPNTFCLTNWYNETDVSVGLVVFNMNKYRNVFFPLLNRMFWEIKRQDAKFIPRMLDKHPEYKDILDLRVFDGTMINAEKYYRKIPRNNVWKDDKTAHYHAWKGELKSNPEEFKEHYNKILDDLIDKARDQQ